MRQEQSDGTRGSALWGRRKGESRASALWGRRGGRSAFVVVAIMLAVPAAAGAGNGNGNGNGNGKGAPAPAPTPTPTATAPIVATIPKALYDTITSKGNGMQKVLVLGRSGVSSATVAADVAAVGGPGTKVRSQFSSINGVSAQLKGDQLLTLATNKDIALITTDDPVSVSVDGQVPATPYVNEEAWRAETGVLPFLSGLGVSQAPTIAIVDSGIDNVSVPNFGARVIARADFSDAGGGLDPEGHGTMVAGIAAGGSSPYPGVAPNANLVDVRVADGSGMALTSSVLAGIDWILQHKDQYGIRVANISLTGTTETSIRFDPLDQAVEKLWLNGIVVVTAAGNQGQPGAPVPLGSPANDPFVITVGALDPNQTATPLDNFRAPWSAYGVTADGFTKPDVSAPGRYMVAPVPMASSFALKAPSRILAPGYMWMSGTSFSAPVVAGAAAQLLAVHPNWTPDQVKGALMAGASRIPGQAGIGIGEVNAAASAAIVSPPNVNENLNAFVSVDPTTGFLTFNAANWVSAVSSNANWTQANWTAANWTSANWTMANWTSANWTSANWTTANWTAANWVS
jgi:serine protease AprX